MERIWIFLEITTIKAFIIGQKLTCALQNDLSKFNVLNKISGIIFILVIDMIESQKAFDAMGFFYVDKTTFMAMISNVTAYLVILMQFWVFWNITVNMVVQRFNLLELITDEVTEKIKSVYCKVCFTILKDHIDQIFFWLLCAINVLFFLTHIMI